MRPKRKLILMDRQGNLVNLSTMEIYQMNRTSDLGQGYYVVNQPLEIAESPMPRMAAVAAGGINPENLNRQMQLVLISLLVMFTHVIGMVGTVFALTGNK